MESLQEDSSKQQPKEEPSLKQKTAKGLLWGGMSNLIQQLLGAFFGVYVSRILSPEDYGVIAVLLIFPVIASTLQESGFVAALVNQKKIEHKDYNAVFWFSTSLGLILYIILYFCAPLIAQFYAMPELTALSRFMFLSFLISSTAVAHNAYLVRHLHVKQRAIGMTTAIFVSGIAGVAMAYMGFAFWGIAAQTVIYVLVNTGFIWAYSAFRPRFYFDFSPIKSIWKFSSKVLITNFFLQLNNNIVTVILGKFYPKDDTGNYSQANKWNIMAQSVLLNMSRSVAQPVLTSVHEERDRQLRVFRKILSFTAFMTFPLVFGLSFISKEFIEIFLTNKWKDSAYFLELLCIGGAFVTVSDVYANLTLSKGKSNIYMWNIICLSVIQLIGFLIVYPYGITKMIGVYSGVSIVWIFIWHYFASREIPLKFQHLLADVLLFAVAAAIAIGCCYLSIHLLHLSAVVSLVLKIGLTAIFYIGIMWLVKKELVKECLQYLKLDRLFIRN